MYRDAWHRICVFGRACSLVRVHVIEMIGVIERKIGGWRGRDGRTDGRTDGRRRLEEREGRTDTERRRKGQGIHGGVEPGGKRVRENWAGKNADTDRD